MSPKSESKLLLENFLCLSYVIGLEEDYVNQLLFIDHDIKVKMV